MIRLGRSAVPALLLLLGAAGPVRALFTANQMTHIDDEPLFDEHYFLSRLSFADPLPWRELWNSSGAPGYRINAASLDCCQLLLEQGLRFERELGGGFRFKFELEQEEDKERQDLHHWLEIDKSLAHGLSLALFGEPLFQKGDSDIGVGLGLRRACYGASARHYFVDFDFNRRGGTDERYTRAPQSDQLALDWEPSPWQRLNAWLEFDSPLRRRVPDQGLLFSYRRSTLRLSWRRLDPAAWNVRVEYAYEFQDKRDDFEPGAPGLSIANRRQVHRVLAALDGAPSARDRIEAGHAFLSRVARSDLREAPAGVFYQRWESQPYARWRRDLRPWLTSDVGLYLSVGDKRSRAAQALAEQRLLEAKAVAGLDFGFPAGRIGLYTTWDLDAPAHPWGGGNARAMFFF